MYGSDNIVNSVVIRSLLYIDSNVNSVVMQNFKVVYCTKHGGQN